MDEDFDEMDGIYEQSHVSLIPSRSSATRDDASSNQRILGSEKPSRYRKHGLWWDVSFKIFKLTIICLAALGLESIIWSTLNPQTQTKASSIPPAPMDPLICDCGGSTQEAISQGCQFIEMAAAWLPPACIDAELANEFDTSGPGSNGTWQYFSDSERQYQISKDQVALLADTGALFYSTWEWHVKHCTFQWRLDYRRRWLDTVVEPRYDHESHIMHCEGIIFADQEKSVGSIVRLNSSNHEPVQHHEHGGHHVHD
ncbi:hypothetical protein EV356DRAFT_495879 [Viridothelium virens]|uniref:Uncharacterized protein n=1 Tax=Viridothelium virens TaxID=1048519 RepID=A0A6A6HPT0_VIRVR|nr:hypothetical protein EV356DRAFT_495879 [Viridothelium virens]